MSIDESAAANCAAWRERADRICDANPFAHEFRVELRSSRVGTNVDAKKMVAFCSEPPPRVLSTPSMHPAGVDGFFREGSWAPRREAVENHLGARGEVVYGTLDLPQMTGDSNYGPFRMVYGPRSDERFLVVPHNSAAVYAPSGVIEEERLHAEVVDWDRRSELAAAERGEVAATLPKASWPRLVANEVKNELSEQDLIEVIARDGSRELKDLDEIRVAQEFAEEVDSLHLEARFAGAGAGDTGMVSMPVPVQALEIVRSLSRGGDFSLTVVRP